MLYAQGIITEVTPTDRSNGVNPVQFQNIVVVEDTSAGAAWLTRNSLTSITQSAAQSSYDSFMYNLLGSWSDDERIKPSKETLPS